MGDFQKVKQFLLNYQDYINDKMWIELLHEANAVGLDNDDVHLMIEMFKKANFPIEDTVFGMLIVVNLSQRYIA